MKDRTEFQKEAFEFSDRVCEMLEKEDLHLFLENIMDLIQMLLDVDMAKEVRRQVSRLKGLNMVLRHSLDKSVAVCEREIASYINDVLSNQYDVSDGELNIAGDEFNFADDGAECDDISWLEVTKSIDRLDEKTKLLEMARKILRMMVKFGKERFLLLATDEDVAFVHRSGNICDDVVVRQLCDVIKCSKSMPEEVVQRVWKDELTPIQKLVERWKLRVSASS